jgi:nucleotide-binding universal stress UspA family protein
MAGRIVVGIDGSPHSAGALDWAAARAALGGQELELVNAYSLPVDFNFYGYQSYAGPEPMKWFTDHSKELLESAATHVRDVAPGVSCTLTSEFGPPAHVISAAAEGADAVVVGRRGLGATRSALLGSVSNKLTVEAACPVIVVGEGELPTSGPVVVGVDGSAFGAAALRFAIGEASVRTTSVRAVTAYQSPAVTLRADAELMARMQAALEAEAADVAAQALDGLATPEDRSVEVERVTVEGRPGEAILRHATDAQLIVVGSHGKGLVRRVLLGSVSREVLQDADRPVAVVDLPAPEGS